MDRFPEDYYLHNLPLLLLSGLDAENHNDLDPSRKAHNLLQEGGFRIRIDAPLIQGDVARHLQESFREQDASNLPWNAQSLASRNGRVFKITSVGRVGQLSLSPTLSAYIHRRCRHMLYHRARPHLRRIHLVFPPLLLLEIHHHNSFYIHHYLL